MTAWRKTLLLLTVVGAVACGSAQKIRLVGVDSFDRHGWAGGDLTLAIGNASAHRLRLRSACVTFYYEGNYVGEAHLMAGVEAPPHALTHVFTRWKLRVPDPAAAYLLLRRIEERRYAGIALDVEAKVRLGWGGRRISMTGVPLSDFIRIFGDPNRKNELE